MKEGVNYNPHPSAIPTCHNQSKFRRISSYFTNFSNTTSDATYKFMQVLAEVFVDKNSDSDPDVADSL